tara:strand:+ start:294 stop:755 length:462 start_codon:yes stop_codon:yes gene_type:complete
MLKKTSLLILFLFICSCEYEPTHSKKNRVNYNFSISSLNFEGDRDINLKIKERLNNYTLKKSDKNFKIKIVSKTEKTILTKNVLGNPTSFKNTITINVEVVAKNNIKTNYVFVENFNYNNNSNKFNLKNYEKEIRNNLSKNATDKLIYKLSNI